MRLLNDGLDEHFREALEAVFGDSSHQPLESPFRSLAGLSSHFLGRKSSRNSPKREFTKHAGTTIDFAALPSINRVSWLIPLADTACAAVSADALQTSESRRGRMKKYSLRAILRSGLGRIFLDRVRVRCPRETALAGLISRVTGERHPLFALLMGASGANRKVVAQAMSPSGEILGYIKIPLTEMAAGRVRFEGRFLEILQRFPDLRPHIPKVLYAGELGETPVLFLTPGLGPPAPARWTPMHEDFLRNLAKLQPKMRSGGALVAEVAERWRRAAKQDRRWIELGRRALDQAKRSMRGVEIPCGIVHGDFVSHQMKIHENRLFVYDWEGAGFDAPGWWDYFHFHVGMLESPPFRGYPGERACFLLYLLNALADYLAVEAHDADDEEFVLLQRLLNEELRPEA